MTRTSLAWLLSLLVVAACGAGGAAGDEAAASAAPTPGGAGGGAGSSGTGADAGLPPEKEIEDNFVSPVATGRFVWVANPASGRVAYIDATSLVVRIVEAGNAPTHLAGIPGSGDTALVLNVLSRDATLLHAEGGALTTRSLAVPSGGNGWAVSGDGRYAIAWTDAARETAPDPLDGYQDVTVLDLAATGADASTALTVGYRPVSVSFDSAGTRAFVVTQDGVSVISLTGPKTVTKNVKIADGAAESTDTRDVAITKDGAYALVRREKTKGIVIVSLDDGKKTTIPLPALATDLDLSPDGSLAIAVLRDTSQVALLPIPAVLSDPNAVKLVTVGTGADVIGSAVLAKESPVAFLYSSAAKSPVLTLLDTSAPTSGTRAILLRAPVAGVFPAIGAPHAVVLHDQPPTDANGKPSTQYKAGFSLVPVAQDLPAKIQGLASVPVAVAIAPKGDRAIVATGTEKAGPWAAYVARLPAQQIDAFDLASPPTSVGIVPEADRAYVAQKHPDGRITFISLSTGELRTLTGFELASQVVYGNGN